MPYTYKPWTGNKSLTAVYRTSDNILVCSYCLETLLGMNVNRCIACRTLCHSECKWQGGVFYEKCNACVLSSEL